ncbi:protein monoglycylase TTLL8 isoform X7 [Mauremys reevesii]|uniref:protein monoglycylase TTLL8 isoform X7 n=1 Tax=Mauremys reevesii TaxID=260615 RepID=UPI00194009E3|nr:protein monoglycylase TTLL8 isoform X7 [Mauremys reevesii]
MMNQIHAERRLLPLGLSDEGKKEEENRMIRTNLPSLKIPKLGVNKCFPTVCCHQGLLPEPNQRIVEEEPLSPRLDKYKLARFLADKAIREKKIFTICGPYPVIRRSLRKKGWVERKLSIRSDLQDNTDDKCDADCEDGGKNGKRNVLCEEVSGLDSSDDIHDVMSRLVRNEETSFFWTIKKDAINYHNLHCDQMLNHYAKTGSFTTKIGLCLNLRNLPWYVPANPNTFFPRCYGIYMDDEKHDFIEDFRNTAACSILKWVISLNACDKKTQKSKGKINKEDVRQKKDPVDSDEKEIKQLPGKLIDMACQQDIDGNHNIWIIKPGAKSRGREIVCKNRMDDILKLVEATDQFPVKDHKWVVQKYIETPLLIYDTKFDIRQWFLVTDWNPLTIWFYKESYLRFSTQRFSLDNLDSSIHLCNNSIQKHYKNAADRNPLLPWHNMWTSTKFQEYLQKRGRGNMWRNVIYPSMKKAITYTMRMAQESVEARKSSFELYGADFILGEDFKPWLIEINTSPTMFPSTPVTAELCAQVQEDTIKVVIEKKRDKNWDTGKFELLWRQPLLDLPPFNVTDLFVEGVGIKRSRQKAAPITNFNFLDTLARIPQTTECASPNHEKQGESIRTVNNKQNIKMKIEKAIFCTLPKPLKRPPGKSCKVRDAHVKPTGHIALPNLVLQPTQSITETKHVQYMNNAKGITDSSFHRVNQTASTFQNMNPLDWPLLQPSKISGLQNSNKKIPCLVCGDTFQLEKTCKRCSSFCATVLQGSSYLPMNDCSTPEKKVTSNKIIVHSSVFPENI